MIGYAKRMLHPVQVGRAARTLRTRLAASSADGLDEDRRSVAEFIEQCAEFGLIPALRALPRQVAVVADAPFYDYIVRHCVFGTLFTCLPLEAARADPRRLRGKREVILFSLRPHRDAMRAIAAAAPGTQVRSAINDWLPDLMVSNGLFRVDPVAPPSAGAGAGATGRRTDYAIFATPRTGSYYLCELLYRAGIGVPKEHLRPAPVRLFRSASGFQPQRFAANLTRSATAGTFFGTKLISHYLLDAVEGNTRRHLLRRWIERHDIRLIHLVREDVVQQAASAVVAIRRDSWRFERSNRHPNLTPPPYDFDELFRFFDAFRRQNRILESFLDSFPRVHRVTYEALESDPLARLNDILAFLGAPGRDTVPAVDSLKIRNDETEAFAERFREELHRRGKI